jgi:hypothetical protein
MSVEMQILVAVVLIAHVLLIFSMCRVSARSERIARERKRDFRRSLINRRGQS